jgi:fused signal recognition particle receptor
MEYKESDAMKLFDNLKRALKKEEKEELKSYNKGLAKTRNELKSKLTSLSLKYKKIDEAYFEELEDILITADIGVNTVMDFIDRLKARVAREKIENPNDLKEIIVDEMFIIYVGDDILTNKIHYSQTGPTVLLFVGVNGVGKTTTIGKIAYKLKQEGKKILLVAGDTFRAGAIEQLEEWSKRVDCDILKKENSDPSSVIYDALTKAKEEIYDVVLIDTAGRLQNKTNLMNELEKMNKVIKNHIPEAPHETLLVLDATTGQNGISQAKSFKEITDITGIVLTKLDGTAKGGIVLAIKEAVGIPVKYVGMGEAKEDLKSFDIEKYIYGLFSDMEDEYEK